MFLMVFVVFGIKPCLAVCKILGNAKNRVKAKSEALCFY